MFSRILSSSWAIWYVQIFLNVLHTVEIILIINGVCIFRFFSYFQATACIIAPSTTTAQPSPCRSRVHRSLESNAPLPLTGNSTWLSPVQGPGLTLNVRNDALPRLRTCTLTVRHDVLAGPRTYTNLRHDALAGSRSYTNRKARCTDRTQDLH